ncbi:DUF4199 domain-containing protein [uncultured Hymenobacter sp.]|uniref:DUF4199 domain-containing protein n=1 Tax=uncultured Hymenobacter sp. TaxID=170016 RepID=UPI0035CC451E
MEVSTQLRPTTSAIAMRFGLLTGVVSIIYWFLLMVTGQMGNSALGFLALAILVGGIVLAQRAFRTSNGGFMSYGEGLGIGMLVSLISGLLSTIFSYVYREFVDPSITQQVADQARAKLEEGGNLSEEQIDQAVAMSQKFSSGPMSLVVGIVGSLIVGLLLSLIISAIMKRTRPEFE